MVWPLEAMPLLCKWRDLFWIHRISNSQESHSNTLQIFSQKCSEKRYSIRIFTECLLDASELPGTWRVSERRSYYELVINLKRVNFLMKSMKMLPLDNAPLSPLIILRFRAIKLESSCLNQVIWSGSIGLKLPSSAMFTNSDLPDMD